MAETYAFCALIEIQTNDPRLSEESLANLRHGGAHEFAVLRRAVLQHLPKDVTRLIGVMPVPEARIMCEIADSISEQIGRPAGRPPADYVPPTRE